MRSIWSVCRRSNDSLICRAVASFELGHKEHPLPEAIAERNSHAPLAFAAVIIPTIVHECNSAIDSSADDPDAVRGVRRMPYVITAQPDRGNLFARLSQSPIDHTVRCVLASGSRTDRGQRPQGHSPIHGSLPSQPFTCNSCARVSACKKE